MADIKQELTEMLNKALELEQAARIQYLAHAEAVKGLGAEPVIARLKEIASDEQKHEEIFRNLIGAYLGGEPSMKLAETFKAKEIRQINDAAGHLTEARAGERLFNLALEVNLKGEKEAVDFYRQIYQKVIENKKNLPYEFETLEHQIRHVIMDEQEHVAELLVLLDA